MSRPMPPSPIHPDRYRPGVGMMLLNQAGLVLVAQRLDAPAQAAWQMPQGGIDAGETPQAAANRELTEEIGVSPHSTQFLAESANWYFYDLPTELAQRLWGGAYIGQRQKWFACAF